MNNMNNRYIGVNNNNHKNDNNNYKCEGCDSANKLLENNEISKGNFLMKKNIPYLGLSDDLLNEQLLPLGDMYID